MNHPLPDMMSGTMNKIRDMIGANAIVGDPIVTADNVTIIPISKVSFGFAGGGSDYVPKTKNGEELPFGGGTGAGVNITPIAFLVCKGENVRMMPISSGALSPLDRFVEQAPDIIERVMNLIDERKAAQEQRDAEE